MKLLWVPVVSQLRPVAQKDTWLCLNVGVLHLPYPYIRCMMEHLLLLLTSLLKILFKKGSLVNKNNWYFKEEALFMNISMLNCEKVENLYRNFLSKKEIFQKSKLISV